MRMKAGRQLVREKSDAVRLVSLRRLNDHARKLAQSSHEIPFAVIGQQRQVGASEGGATEIEIGEHRLSLPQDATDARMSVLNVEDRIVLALLDHFRQIEIERGVVLAHQHDEADGVGANLVDDLAQASRSPRSASTF